MKKKRGVRASRIKLEEALANSSISPTTQIALANAIADQEGLSVAPRDLISKLFRERLVDPKTVERVAQVLGVAARSLYLENPDFSAQPKTKKGVGIKTKRLSKKWIAIIALPVLLLAGFGVWSLTEKQVFLQKCTGLTNINANTAADKLGVVIGRFAGDRDNEIQRLLADAFIANEKLSKHVTVFISCSQFDIAANTSYIQGLQDHRQKAQADIRAVNGHIFVWGERSKDQLNIRYTSLAASGSGAVISTDKRSLATNETYFSIPVRLSTDRKLPAEIAKIALDLMSVKTEARLKTLSTLKSKFASSGDWVRDAVTSDRNLLRTISSKTNPALYSLTGNQLCYRYRLLGDYEYSQSVYVEAEQVCREVLANLPEENFSSVRALIQNNLGTIIVRQHLFATTLLERFKILDEARKMFEGIEEQIKQDNLVTTYATFNNNLSLTYLRLGEITGGDDSLAYFIEANRRANLSLDATDKNTHLKHYATTKQNLCLIGHRLANLTKKKEYAIQAISDCKEAVLGFSQKSAPQVWGTAQNNLAVSYAVFAELSKNPVALKTAITEFSKAQINFTKERFPVNWAEVEVNKAVLNCRLALLKQDATYFDETKEHAILALPVFIENNVARYVGYTTGLLDIVKSCDLSNISNCKCSP